MLSALNQLDVLTYFSEFLYRNASEILFLKNHSKIKTYRVMLEALINLKYQ